MKKPIVAISFLENGENGGPYNSHKRIMESDLKNKYEFVPLMIPRFRERINPGYAIKFIKNIRSVNPDIIHFSGLELEGFHVLLLLKMANRGKTVCAIRGSNKDVIFCGRIRRKIVTWMEHWTLRHSNVCYGVSKYVANWDFVKSYAKKSYGNIYNFFDFSDISSKELIRRQYRQEFSFSDDDIVIISTGRITVEKGFATLCDAILKLDKIKNIKFLIIGDGSYRNEMEYRIQKGGIHDKVIFTGYRNDVSNLLDAADIFVSCTLHETLGNSIIEASYHGLPVVATMTGGIPEIVLDNQTGYLVAIEDVSQVIGCLNKLIINKELREKMGIEGMKYIESTFNKVTIENQLDELYKSVLAD